MQELLQSYLNDNPTLEFVAAWQKQDNLLIVFCDNKNRPFARIIDKDNQVHEVPFYEIRNFDPRASQSPKILTRYLVQMRLDIGRYRDGGYSLTVNGALLGGTFLSMLVSGALTIGGAVAVVATGGAAAPIIGAAAFSGGLIGVKRGIENPQEGLNGAYVKDVAINATVGAVTAGIGTYITGLKAAKDIATASKTAQAAFVVGRGAASGIAGSATGTVVKAATEVRLPTAGELGSAILEGAAAGGAGGAISGISAATAEKVAKVAVGHGVKVAATKAIKAGVRAEDIANLLTPDNLDKAVKATAAAGRMGAGMVAGGVSAAAAKATENLTAGREIDAGLAETVFRGAAIGGLTATLGHTKATTPALIPQNSSNSYKGNSAATNGTKLKRSKEGEDHEDTSSQGPEKPAEIPSLRNLPEFKGLKIVSNKRNPLMTGIEIPKDDKTLTIWASTQPIASSSADWEAILAEEARHGKTIAVLTGTHGSSDGLTSENDPDFAELNFFFNSDLKFMWFREYNEGKLRIIDVHSDHIENIKQFILDSTEDVIILDWCWSERNKAVIEAVKELYKRAQEKAIYEDDSFSP